LWLYAKTGSFDYVCPRQALASGTLGVTPQALTWAALAFLVAFAVKVPVFPLHGWLGDVISEAPTGICHGRRRQAWPLFHPALQPRALSRPGKAGRAVDDRPRRHRTLYGALVALVQKDMKRLAAYATMSGLSFCTLGIFSFVIAGVDGSVYQILSHEISGSALLVLLGFLYERFGTYDIASYGGLAAKMPRYATLFITSLSLIGLPILNGFVGEFLILSSSLRRPCRLGCGRDHRRHPQRCLHVVVSAAYLLRANLVFGHRQNCPRPALP
jgi:NADH-quinone oxidoreductase subunit M